MTWSCRTALTKPRMNRLSGAWWGTAAPSAAPYAPSWKSLILREGPRA
jgi:hypothetical protein